MFTEKPVVTSIEETFALAELRVKYALDRVMAGLVLRYMQHMVDLRHAPVAHRFDRRATCWKKCCHDLDIYNMVTASRPLKEASFGGQKSFLPEHAPARNSENDIFTSEISLGKCR